MVTVVRAAGASGSGCSVRTIDCVPPGFGLSCSASPTAMPTAKTTRGAEREQHDPVHGR